MTLTFFKNRRVSRSWIVLLLVLAIGLSATKQLERTFHAAGLDGLAASNEAYLDSALKKTLGTFALLSTLKVGLAIIEGAEIGVGFGVEIGDAVQSAYDVVDLAWRVVLASAAILLGTRFLLQAAGLVDHWLLAAALLFILIALLLRWTRGRPDTVQRLVRDVSLVSVILTLTLYLVLPLSVAGGRLLSSRITRPSIAQAEEGVARFKTDVLPGGDEGSTGFWSRFANPQEHLKSIARAISQKATEFSMWILGIIAGYVFDTLVFPLLLFIIGVWLTKSIMKYAYALNRESFLSRASDNR